MLVGSRLFCPTQGEAHKLYPIYIRRSPYEFRHLMLDMPFMTAHFPRTPTAVRGDLGWLIDESFIEYSLELRSCVESLGFAFEVRGLSPGCFIYGHDLPARHGAHECSYFCFLSCHGFRIHGTYHGLITYRTEHNEHDKDMRSRGSAEHPPTPQHNSFCLDL
jgi:hypothetical protein